MELIDYADGSEQYLEEIFKKTKHISSYPTELASFIRDWPSRYHLSHQRVNLLESIKELFNREWKVLELGAGLGALTRWLADNFRHIDAVEGNYKRAEVNRLRTRENENVRVLVSDIMNLSYPDTYDLVTLIGVLEYVPLYSKRSPHDACVSLLKDLRKAMNKDALLLVAIENQLGLKYWTGCREDHTGRFFDSLVNYPNQTPITFSRNELEDILKAAGFEFVQFYHLFPDYKLPTLIIRESDEVLSLHPHQWLRGFFEDYSGERLYILPDPLVLESLVHARLLWHFSNSFLVVCSPSPSSKLITEWLLKKFWNHLKPSFHHTTTLQAHNDHYRIEREPIYTGKSNVSLETVDFTLRSTKFVDGTLLVFEAYKALLSDAWKDKIKALTSELSNELIQQHFTGQYDEENYHLLKRECLDCTFWNVIRTPQNRLVFIDSKWRYRNKLSADFVLFRNLFWLFWNFKPFVKEKSVMTLIEDIIRQIYPQYDTARLEKNFDAEWDFQSQVSGQRESKANIESLMTSTINILDKLASGDTGKCQGEIP